MQVCLVFDLIFRTMFSRFCNFSKCSSAPSWFVKKQGMTFIALQDSIQVTATVSESLSLSSLSTTFETCKTILEIAASEVVEFPYQSNHIHPPFQWHGHDFSDLPSEQMEEYRLLQFRHPRYSENSQNQHDENNLLCTWWTPCSNFCKEVKQAFVRKELPSTV